MAALGHEYHAVVTNWSELSVQVHFALEDAVISKVPIIRAIEYDASPVGHHQAFSHQGPVAGIVSERVLSSQGIVGFGDPLAPTDRGTLRVDLANGLTIFPLHLKSNRNDACQALSDAIKTLGKSSLPVPDDARRALDQGFPRATAEHVSNAEKREGHGGNG